MSNELTVLLKSNLPIEQKTHLAAKLVLTQPQASAPVVHKFSKGKYIREVHCSAGVFAVGHKQKTTHLNIMVKGKVELYNEDGTTSILEAPQMFYSPPGRKMGMILEDMVWQNVYETDETDVEILEELYLDKHPDEVVPKNSASTELDREDFLDTITALGFSEEEVRKQSEIDIDLIPFPYGEYKVQVSDSTIDGKGLFATGNFECGEVICPASINGKRTPAGRYTNHSRNPNAYALKLEDGMYLVASEQIKGSSGGQLGEEITVDYLETYLMSRS